jgi:hypothetical protein
MASVSIQQSSSHSNTFEPRPTVPIDTTKHHVQTQLNYYKEAEDGSPPAPTYIDRPETYERPAQPLDVTVCDIKGEVNKYTLDGSGFQIYSHASAEKDFLDDNKIRANYYPETEQLLKDA